MRFAGASLRKLEGKMKLKRYWSLVPIILVMAASSAPAQNLIHGRREVKDTISFPVEITQFDEQTSHITTAIEVRFERPATGTISIDGRGLDRFDQGLTFLTQQIDLRNGQHTVTVRVKQPAVLQVLWIHCACEVRQIVRDDGREPVDPPVEKPIEREDRPITRGGPTMEQRMADLEQRVRDLEMEVDTLKKARRIQ
jgi:hypothetical protein